MKIILKIISKIVAGYLNCSYLWCKQKGKNIMKTIYTITTEHDGLQNACFTNIKALHEFLTNEMQIGKSKLDVTYPDGTYKPFDYGYQKLVYGIRNSQKLNRVHMAHIQSSELGTISISELAVISK